MDERFEENLGEGFEEAHRELIMAMEERTRKMGLHLESAALGAPVGEGGPALMLMATFRLGDLAFSPRVMDPEQAQFDAGFRELRDATENAEYEELRQRYLNGELDIRRILGEET